MTMTTKDCPPFYCLEFSKMPVCDVSLGVPTRNGIIQIGRSEDGGDFGSSRIRVVKDSDHISICREDNNLMQVEIVEKPLAADSKPKALKRTKVFAGDGVNNLLVSPTIEQDRIAWIASVAVSDQSEVAYLRRFTGTVGFYALKKLGLTDQLLDY